PAPPPPAPAPPTDRMPTSRGRSSGSPPAGPDPPPPAPPAPRRWRAAAAATTAAPAHRARAPQGRPPATGGGVGPGRSTSPPPGGSSGPWTTHAPPTGAAPGRSAPGPSRDHSTGHRAGILAAPRARSSTPLRRARIAGRPSPPSSRRGMLPPPRRANPGLVAAPAPRGARPPRPAPRALRHGSRSGARRAAPLEWWGTHQGRSPTAAVRLPLLLHRRDPGLKARPRIGQDVRQRREVLRRPRPGRPGAVVGLPAQEPGHAGGLDAHQHGAAVEEDRIAAADQDRRLAACI